MISVRGRFVSQRKRRAVQVLAVAIMAALACTACRSGADRRTQCAALRDHLIDLRLSSVPPSIAAEHRANLRKAMGDSFVDQCTAYSDGQLDCMLAAKDLASSDACAHQHTEGQGR